MLIIGFVFLACGAQHRVIAEIPAPMADVTLPKVINYQEFAKSIKYPQQCRIMGVEGKVLLRLRVNEWGRVEDYSVLEAPDKLMEKACLNSVYKLRFEPAQDDQGKLVPAYVYLPVVFKLTYSHY